MAVSAALAAYVALGLKQETDITLFMPEAAGSDAAGLKRFLDSGGYAKTMILAVGFPAHREKDAAKVTDLVGEGLDKSGLFDEVKWKVDYDPAKAVFKTYFDSRFALASSKPEEELPGLLSRKGLEKRLDDLKALLAAPSGILMKSMVTRDPLLLFETRMEMFGLQSRMAAAPLCGDRFCSRDGRWFLIMARTKAEAMDIAAQERVMHVLERMKRVVEDQLGRGSSFKFTGVNRFAVESAGRIRHDISIAMALSVFGVVFLFWAFFRRIRVLPLTMVPLGFGMLIATAATQWAFGSVHGLTLAFGSTLIGIGIDFPIHILNHFKAGGAGELGVAGIKWRKLVTSLFMGMFTTLLGFGAMFLSSYPGVRQIALFSGVGVLAVFVFSIAFLPWAHEKGWLPASGGLGRPASLTLSNVVVGFTSRRPKTVILSVVILVTASAPRFLDMKEEHDIRNLQAAEPETLAEDKYVRSLVPGSSMGLLLFSKGTDLEEALKLNDDLFVVLDEATKAGRVEGFHSLHPFLPSAALQRQNLEWFEKIPDLPDRIKSVMQGKGFRPSAFQPFFDDLSKVRGGDGTIVTPESVENTPGVSSIIKNVLFKDGERSVVVTLAKPANPADLLSDVVPKGVTAFSEVAFANTALARFHEESALLIGIGLVVIMLVLLVYKRDVRLAAAAFSPSVIAGAIVLAGLSAFGQKINFLHVASLLLILCMGVDYGIFVCDGLERLGSGGLEAAFRSVVMSSLTTCFTFGVLAVCRNPALESIGYTVGPGILLAAMLALTFTPAVWAVGRHAARAAAGRTVQ